jgi:hypothetical protein
MVKSAKNKGISSFFCLAMLVMLQSNSCTSCSGVPSDFNKVILHATSTDLNAGQSTTITATVPRDNTGAGVSWVFTPQAGVINAGTFTVNSVFSATYAAPTTAVAAKFTVVIQATSIAFPSEVNTITITIEPTATLKVTIAALPNGVVGTVYPSGTQLQATGGVPPYTWSLTGGTTLPAGLTLNPDGTIVGTPLGPPGVDNTFTVQVADSETPTPMTATTTAGQLSITITNLLNGNYAFEFSGFNSTGAVVVAGSFTADGVGTISNGVEDVNSIAGPPKNQTFTGTFTITNGNRGQIVFSSLVGTPTYDFAIDSTGAHARIIEFDATGVRGSGQLEQQTANANTCGSSTLSGAGPLGANYVIGVSGATGNFTGVTPGPMAMVGRFTAEVPANSTTPGNIDTGEVDISYPQNVIVQSASFSGTFQTTNQPAHCSMSLTQAVSTMNFSVYPVTSTGGLVTEAFVVETDALSSATPFVTVGKMVEQLGYPFTIPSNSLASPSVGGLYGSVIPQGQAAYLPFVAVGQLNPSGGGAFTMPLFENIGGTPASFTGSTIAATLNPGDSFGRVDTTLVLPVEPVFYVFGPNEAFCILENLNAPVLGIFEPQSTGGFSTTTVAAAFAEGTATPSTTATTDFSGVVTIASTGTSTGTIAGTQDTSTSVANTAGQTVTGTVTLSGTGTTDGTGSLILTAPAAFTGQFIIVSPTKIAVISTTAGDLNPVLFYLGNCEGTCGED